MDEDIKAKQQYLRKEVIDKGFDPSKFVEFLSSKRDNGTLL